MAEKKKTILDVVSETVMAAGGRRYGKPMEGYPYTTFLYVPSATAAALRAFEDKGVEIVTHDIVNSRASTGLPLSDAQGTLYGVKVHETASRLEAGM